jgi:hypothetical protein
MKQIRISITGICMTASCLFGLSREEAVRTTRIPGGLTLWF